MARLCFISLGLVFTLWHYSLLFYLLFHYFKLDVTLKSASVSVADSAQFTKEATLNLMTPTLEAPYCSRVPLLCLVGSLLAEVPVEYYVFNVVRHHCPFRFLRTRILGLHLEAILLMAAPVAHCLLAFY